MRDVVVISGLLTAAAVASAGLAWAGEPSSAWLWSAVFQVNF